MTSQKATELSYSSNTTPHYNYSLHTDKNKTCQNYNEEMKTVCTIGNVVTLNLISVLVLAKTSNFIRCARQGVKHFDTYRARAD